MRSNHVRYLAAAVVGLLLATLPAVAQENDDCLMCHEDPDLTGERRGREVSMFVAPDALDESAHAGFDCIVCHQDLDGAEIPHDDELEPAACAMCHDTEAEKHTASLHGQAAARGDEMAPTCGDCHGSHDIVSHTDPNSRTAKMNIPVLCGQCHREGSPVSRTHEIDQDNILENYSLSIHGEGLFKKGLTVTAVCTSCHTAHDILPHEDPTSSIHAENIADTCTACHRRIEQVHRKVIEGELWEEEPHKIPVCVDCHAPHKIRNVRYPAGMANQDCLECHSKPDLTMVRAGETVSLHVDQDAFATSAHGNTACAQCHTEVQASRERACETIENPVDCSICHAETVTEYTGSTHGTLAASGDPDAPVCLDCHDNHATMRKTVPTSPTFPRNVPVLCGQCHREGEQAAVRIESEITDIVGSYEDSIHGTGLLDSGLVVTATCASCHGAHSELPPEDPRSMVHPENISDTCGKCHNGIESTFLQSVHSPLVTNTDKELPTCEDCHSSHEITRTDQNDYRLTLMDQCGRCHESEATTFFDTFHGKVSRLGSAGAAKCYDCHGTHNILPPEEPESALGRDNVVETCGQCHEGSHRQFAGYLTHATHHDPEKYPYLFIAFWGMTALLVGTLGFATVHTGAWLTRLHLSKADWKHEATADKAKTKYVRRFDAKQRTFHLVMLLSFFTLAITGMALKFSYMTWAEWISDALGGFQVMGTLHRIAGLVLFYVFISHVLDVRKRKNAEGQSWKELILGPNSMMFNKRDWVEFVQSWKWFFGVGPRPKYGRFTYWEKFDYFAVFWGVFIIGSTGLILWFPEAFTRILPGWSVNVATIIHSDEALLAVAFIFTVHFFNTHFRPDKFPMDPVIFTGRVPLEEFKKDKPREYEELVKSGKLEEKLVDAFPHGAERGFRIFGFVALFVGLTLIGLIIYAMLFAYL